MLEINVKVSYSTEKVFDKLALFRNLMGDI